MTLWDFSPQKNNLSSSNSYPVNKSNKVEVQMIDVSNLSKDPFSTLFLI